MSIEKNPVHHYGVNENTSSRDDVSLHAEEIFIKGYTIVPDILNADGVDVAKQKLNEVYQKQLEELSEDVFQTINDKDIARALLVYDDFFLTKITLHPTIIAILDKTLGKNYILREQNGILNKAKSPNYQLKWHRDLMFQHFTSSRPIAISALFCLADFNEQNGGTYILPASHKIEPFPSEEYIRKNEICANAPVGSAIVFDSMLYHRAGRNTSENDRLGVNNMYVQAFMKQAINFPKMLNGKYSDDALSRKVLGYDTDTDDSVVEWRTRRYNRIRGK